MSQKLVNIVLTQVHSVTAKDNFINRKVTMYKLSLRMKGKSIHYVHFKIIYCSL